MSYPAYPELHVSRHAWLGLFPSTWDSVNIRLIAKRYSGGTPDKSNSLYWIDGTVPWLNSGEVNQGVITEPTTFITEEALAESSAKWVPPNAIIIALAGQGKTKGMAAITTFKTTCNQSMAAVVFETDHSKFMYWWLVSQYRNIRGMASDDARDGLNLEMIATIPCPRPSAGEQQKIAAFLDWKTGQIDALIARKKELLEKLKEKRIAVITQAVSKGLNPAVPMRDCGIPWLGQVPQHWEVIRLRFLVEAIDQGWSPRASNVAAEDGELGVLKLSAVDCGKFDPEENKMLEEVPENQAIQNPRKHDILVTRANTPELVGDVCSISQDFPHLIIPDLIYRLKVDCARSEERFVSFFLLSKQGRAQIEANARGSSGSMVKLGQGHLKDFQIPSPSLEEQKKIANYVEEQTVRIDLLMGRINEAIDRLTEYRTALITAATTGKIDVRKVKLRPAA